jgi:hypothetical protein
VAGVDDVAELWLTLFTIVVGKPVLWRRARVERWLWSLMIEDLVVRKRVVWLDRLVCCACTVVACVVEALPCRRTPRLVICPGAEWEWLPAWELLAPVWAIPPALDAELFRAAP